MATPVELLTTAVVTAIVVLLTTILFRKTAKQPLQPPTIKCLTLRIDDIPADQTDDLDRNVKSIIEQDPTLRAVAATPVRRSLAPKDKHSMCATISIRTSLSADDLSARLRRVGNGYPYRYTCKFDGITPLYEDQNGADVDIIAVPGLGSHALGSWKSPNSDDVWIRDFLPKDVPNIRVLLYGYDTVLPGSLSKQSIEDLGGALLEQIIAFRAKDGTSHRPIIFIGHSLGGLLIKEALVRARRRPSDANSDLSKASYGLLFFGVPNLGLRNDQLRTLVRGQPNEALIHDLLVDNDSEPSAFLKRLADQFSESCKGHYRLDKAGQWRKTGPPSLLVTEKSTTSTGLVAMAEEDNIALNTDHSGLVKYDSSNQGDYTIVRERLNRLVDKAKQEVAKRFAEHNLYQPQSETTQACLRSLAFEDMDGRPNEIGEAADGTCKWLLKHNTLIQWTRRHRGVLWIKGKPGSGKSTIMKFALRKLPALCGADTQAFAFFFHGRGHELQRSPLGLLRSLLHQLLSRVPGALGDLVDYFDAKRKSMGEPGEKWQWYLQSLQKYLQSALPRILKRFPVILVIDALDECGQQSALELIEYLKRTLSRLPPNDSQFGICFSCRHYPILALDGGLTIRLESENEQDIATFVEAHVSINHLDADVGRLIIQRAQGIFMWARLVLKQVLLLDRDGEPTARIMAEIEGIPPDLNGLYVELINAVKHRSTTLKLMQWICFSTRPLTTDELQWALAVDPDCAWRSLDECQASDDFIADDKFDRRINNLSCGLAEIIPSKDARVVRFIHQSVKDFFVGGGLWALDKTKPDHEVVPAAHCRLSRTCLQYFKLIVHSNEQPISQEEISRFPFIRTPLSWAAENGQEAVVKMLLDTDKVNVDLRDKYGRTPLSWAAQNGREAVVRLLLDTGKVDVDSRDNDDRTPLWWAAGNGREAVVRMLLDTGKVGVDSKDAGGRTPLLWAAERRNDWWTAEGAQDAVVKMLLDTDKVDVDSRDKNGRSPLWWAAGNGREAVVRMLLDTGKVDVDSSDNDGRSPLSWAAQNGREAVVRMLLDTDKVYVDSSDNDGRSPLSWAAQNGREAVVRMLLNTDKVDVDSKDRDGRTPLTWAAENGHKTVARILLDTGKVDVNSRDNDGWTPLWWAIGNGREAVVKMLLDTGKVDVSSRDNDGWTPLWWAIGNGREAVVKMLLDTGKVDVDSRDNDGRSPLLWAARMGREVAVRMLLDTGRVDINSRDEIDRTPLSWAARNGKEAVVKILLDTGKVDIDLKDGYDRTPLLLAARNGHEAVVRMLLDTGMVDINSRDRNDRTPLSWAARNGKEAVIRILLDTGKVKVNPRDSDGWAPLLWAAKNGREAAVRILLDTSKVDFDSRDNNGQTPLSWAVGNGHEEVARMLLDTDKVDISAEDACGLTVLQLAAFNYHPRMEELLIARGAPIVSDFYVIFADLSTLGSSVNSDDFNFDHIKPRLNVALADDLDDVLVWDQVYNAVTPVSAPDSIFPPPPLYSIDHRTHTIVQLPLEKDADVS
ncbi:hypothetical protein ACJ41O_013856 [Fusarium nematophilum]